MFDGPSSYIDRVLPALILKKPEPKKVTLEQFMRQEERREGRGLPAREFYAGTIKQSSMAKLPHNQIISNLSQNFLNFFDEKGLLDHFVLTGQQKIYVPLIDSVMIPDAIVICEKPLFWDDNEQLLLNPVLIVEVASPSTKKYDETNKFGKYQLIPSFREYLLIDPEYPKAEDWHREDEDLWRKSRVEGLEKTIHLASIGLDLSLEKIYRRVEF